MFFVPRRTKWPDESLLVAMLECSWSEIRTPLNGCWFAKSRTQPDTSGERASVLGPSMQPVKQKQDASRASDLRNVLMINALKPPNNAHHWRRAKNRQYVTDTECRRPVDEPG